MLNCFFLVSKRYIILLSKSITIYNPSFITIFSESKPEGEFSIVHKMSPISTVFIIQNRQGLILTVFTIPLNKRIIKPTSPTCMQNMKIIVSITTGKKVVMRQIGLRSKLGYLYIQNAGLGSAPWMSRALVDLHHSTGAGGAGAALSLS